MAVELDGQARVVSGALSSNPQRAAENLLEFVTGEKVRALCADLTACVPGRALEDDANMLLGLQNGGRVYSPVHTSLLAKKTVSRFASMEARRAWNGTRWNQIRSSSSSRDSQVKYFVLAKALTRIPAGHPQSYLEAFANLYKLIIADIRGLEMGQQLQGGYPDVYDGLRGMQFMTGPPDTPTIHRGVRRPNVALLES